MWVLLAISGVEQIAEKRFPATPKRKQEARKKGQVLKSQELISAAILLALIGVLRFWLPKIFERTAELFRYFIAYPAEWTVATVWKASAEIFWQCILILGPIFLIVIVLALAVNFLQVGALFTLQPLKPQFSRIYPLEGIKRMFGLKAMVQLVKAIFKVLIIGYFLYAVISKNLNVFPTLQQYPVAQSLSILSKILFELAWKIALSFLILAIADFLYQWWEYEKNLRMSHQEIKEEYKQTEGIPSSKRKSKRTENDSYAQDDGRP
jgi:flagellar biosynthetic protein FlhB